MQLYLLFNFILIIFGCFLPWIHSAIFVVRLNGIEMLDGQIVFFVSLFALFLSFYKWFRKQPPLWSMNLLAGLIIIAICGLELYQFSISRYPIGPGLYISLLGGIQVFGCSLRGQFNRALTTPAPAAGVPASLTKEGSKSKKDEDVSN
ncbi:MAG: hypothetical protein AAB300_03875 [Nitrospirota bacterium]